MNNSTDPAIVLSWCHESAYLESIDVSTVYRYTQHTQHCTVYSLMMVVCLICSHLHIISRWGVGSRHFSACCDCHIQNSPRQMYAHLNHLLCMSLFFCSEPTHPKTVDGNVCSSRCNGICSQQHHKQQQPTSTKKRKKRENASPITTWVYMIGINQWLLYV